MQGFFVLSLGKAKNLKISSQDVECLKLQIKKIPEIYTFMRFYTALSKVDFCLLQ